MMMVDGDDDVVGYNDKIHTFFVLGKAQKMEREALKCEMYKITDFI
jgi:hypothetical protein